MCSSGIEKYDNVEIEIIKQPESTKTSISDCLMDDKILSSIRVKNYTGDAVAIVCCVSKNKPYTQHPHSLVGKRCNKGVCIIEFTTDMSDTTVVSFVNGIRYAKKSDILESLTQREKYQIDPYKAGFEHKENLKSINLNSFRLCFQVILKPDSKTRVRIRPVVSLPIQDRKLLFDLVIVEVSDSASPTCGGRKIIILCDKVFSDDIKVRFFEETSEGVQIWEDWGIFYLHNVHRDIAISFTTPKYKIQDIDSPVKVYMQLFRPSDKARSAPSPFIYIPDKKKVNLAIESRKRKIDETNVFIDYLKKQSENSKREIKMNINIDSNIKGGFCKNTPADANQVDISRFNTARKGLLHSLQPIQFQQAENCEQNANIATAGIDDNVSQFRIDSNNLQYSLAPHCQQNTNITGQVINSDVSKFNTATNGLFHPLQPIQFQQAENCEQNANITTAGIDDNVSQFRIDSNNLQYSLAPHCQQNTNITGQVINSDVSKFNTATNGLFHPLQPIQFQQAENCEQNANITTAGIDDNVSQFRIDSNNLQYSLAPHCQQNTNITGQVINSDVSKFNTATNGLFHPLQPIQFQQAENCEQNANIATAGIDDNVSQFKIDSNNLLSFFTQHCQQNTNLLNSLQPTQYQQPENCPQYTNFAAEVIDDNVSNFSIDSNDLPYSLPTNCQQSANIPAQVTGNFEQSGCQQNDSSEPQNPNQCHHALNNDILPDFNNKSCCDPLKYYEIARGQYSSMAENTNTNQTSSDEQDLAPIYYQL